MLVVNLWVAWIFFFFFFFFFSLMILMWKGASGRCFWQVSNIFPQSPLPNMILY